jgi:hypothetical protein
MLTNIVTKIKDTLKNFTAVEWVITGIVLLVAVIGLVKLAG